ncbi:MAG: cytochrome c peroxidase, partial [Gammaproteobacteria bacterium]
MAKLFFKRMVMSFIVVLAVIAGAAMLLDKAVFLDGPVTQPSADIIDVLPPADPAHVWTADQKKLIESLWIGNLPPLPPDPSNAVADNKTAAELGHKLFFDTRLSANGEVSCATCHQPDLIFTDGLPRSQGIGVTRRKAMTVVGVTYSDWFFWDGRKDSLWAQALGPTEDPAEHGGNRSQFAHLLGEDKTYRQLYESVFGEFPDISNPDRFPESAGPVPDPGASEAWDNMTPDDQKIINRIFSNMGKAIAAYERLIIPGPARFDKYIEAVHADDQGEMADTFSTTEANGLRLFIGRAQCINCHNGPLLTNNTFHNTGVPPAQDLPPDHGRAEGIKLAMDDPFNCMGEFSDADPKQCAHLRFARTEGAELMAAFKTGTLRNIEKTRP